MRNKQNPIGKHTVPRAELQQLDRLTIKFAEAARILIAARKKKQEQLFVEEENA